MTEQTPRNTLKHSSVPQSPNYNKISKYTNTAAAIIFVLNSVGCANRADLESPLTKIDSTDSSHDNNSTDAQNNDAYSDSTPEDHLGDLLVDTIQDAGSDAAQDAATDTDNSFLYQYSVAVGNYSNKYDDASGQQGDITFELVQFNSDGHPKITDHTLCEDPIAPDCIPGESSYEGQANLGDRVIIQFIRDSEAPPEYPFIITSTETNPHISCIGEPHTEFHKETFKFRGYLNPDTQIAFKDGNITPVPDGGTHEGLHEPCVIIDPMANPREIHCAWTVRYPTSPFTNSTVCQLQY